MCLEVAVMRLDRRPVLLGPAARLLGADGGAHRLLGDPVGVQAELAASAASGVGASARPDGRAGGLPSRKSASVTAPAVALSISGIFRMSGMLRPDTQALTVASDTPSSAAKRFWLRPSCRRRGPSFMPPRLSPP